MGEAYARGRGKNVFLKSNGRKEGQEVINQVVAGTKMCSGDQPQRPAVVPVVMVSGANGVTQHAH